MLEVTPPSYLLELTCADLDRGSLVDAADKHLRAVMTAIVTASRELVCSSGASTVT